VREVNIGKLERPDILHASPVCKNASVAKSGAREAPEDVETAHATARFIEKLRPSIFTLENVWGYRNFVAFRVILDCLRREGYAVDYWHLNAANYAVPQTRKRLVLVAKLDGTPRRPEPTHAKNPGGMFGLKKWVGWYEAIEDLIPTLPESKFAQWQLDRMPEYCDYTMTVDSAGYPDKSGATVPVMREQSEPANTIVSNYYRREMRAFIINNQQSDDHRGGTYGVTTRHDDEPAITITDSFVPKAFIVGGANTSETQAAPGVGVSEQDEPTRCVASNAGQWRTWLSQGRVVAMTPRCLARFQSFPDDYILPASNKLACQVIGNAVPPLLYQRVIEANL
jgi:site-specific DNA-cytosine methylase